MFAAVEYPGYVCEELTPHGNQYLTSSVPSEHNVKTHALAVLDTLQSQWPDVPVICVGRSLGCGVALWLSTVRNVSGLLLLAPYLSIMRVGVRWSLPFVDIFDNALIAHKCQSKNIIIVHSEDDPVIPIQHSQELVQKLTQVCSHVKLLHRRDDGHEAPYLESTKFVNKILFHLGLILS